MKEYGTILNIAAGKLEPINIDFKNYFLINIDTMYYNALRPISVETIYQDNIKSKSKSKFLYCNEDIFTFMERTKILFDQVCAYRFLEHISKDKISYFIYLISTCTKPGALIDIIVPNYNILANMILNEKIENNINFEKDNILLTTELLNEKEDPHCSIWTYERLKYFWELENRFKIKDINQSYNFDGRDIYLRMIAEKI